MVQYIAIRKVQQQFPILAVCTSRNFGRRDTVESLLLLTLGTGGVRGRLKPLTAARHDRGEGVLDRDRPHNRCEREHTLRTEVTVSGPNAVGTDAWAVFSRKLNKISRTGGRGTVYRECSQAFRIGS